MTRGTSAPTFLCTVRSEMRFADTLRGKATTLRCHVGMICGQMCVYMDDFFQANFNKNECNSGIKPGVTRGADVKCSSRLTQRHEFMESVVEANMGLTFRHETLLIKIDVLHIFEKPTTIATLSILSKNQPVMTMNSIAAGFPILDVEEFIGWVELENWPFDHLSVVGHGSF